MDKHVFLTEANIADPKEATLQYCISIVRYKIIAIFRFSIRNFMFCFWFKYFIFVFVFSFKKEVCLFVVQTMAENVFLEG